MDWHSIADSESQRIAMGESFPDPVDERTAYWAMRSRYEIAMVKRVGIEQGRILQRISMTLDLILLVAVLLLLHELYPKWSFWAWLGA